MCYVKMIRNGGCLMANDVIFKTKAFGGYNKEEVMTYINRLISEKEALETKCKELTDANNSLKSETEQKTEKIKTLENDAVSLLEKINELSAVNESVKNEVELAESEKEKQTIEILKLNNELNEIKNKSVLSEEDAEILKTENLKLKTECDKLKAMEQQVGAAMLDARLRSDELVKEAEEKAELVRKDVYDAIGDTALKIDELSGGIAEIASSFTKAVGEMEMRINVLTGNMSKTAQALISNTLEMPVRIQNSVTTEQSGIYDDVVNDIEMSLIEAEQELENMKESFSNNDQEHKAKIKIKAKPVSDE